ncbi:hypothetical protein [Teredinibacter turnerae]|uniref:hypothetical protein n=1 Tax=Teredinibacter turnerae TaxID=2426 RepID=UPI0030D4189A
MTRTENAENTTQITPQTTLAELLDGLSDREISLFAALAETMRICRFSPTLNVHVSLVGRSTGRD